MYVAKHHKKRLHCLREKAVLCFNLDGTKTFKGEKKYSVVHNKTEWQR